MKTVFTLSSLLVMPFWVMMAFLPKWKVTERVVRSPWIVAPAALLYSILVLPHFGELMVMLQRPQLEPIAELLGTETGATIAWVHFLAFDLFVGRWIYLDSRERNISPWLMAPVLYLVLMLAPFGLLVYGAVRLLSPKRAAQAASPSITEAA